MSDGNIQAAKKRLGDAIHELVDPQPRTVYLDSGVIEATWLDSHYHQLRESVAGQNVAAKGDSRQARAPIWIDAHDLLQIIDRTVAEWCTDKSERGKNATVSRLLAVKLDSYRPQDTERVHTRANTVREWVGRIKTLLDPESIKHISAPCPACGTTTVFRKDSSGEMVRQPALQLVTNQGCTCVACKTHWDPTKYLFLCKLLGFELPDGVLE